MANKNEVAILGGGCFWCTEAVFNSLRGVVSVTPGYAGGDLETPTYEDVSTGKTGHAEVIRIEYNPSEISFNDLLTVFFAVHDPTTPNRQGNDIGSQYRSIIIYTTKDQKDQAEAFIKELDRNTKEKIVTELKPLDSFFEAESYHHKYYEKNQNQPYCQLVISPKLDKLKEKFTALLAQNS